MCVCVYPDSLTVTLYKNNTLHVHTRCNFWVVKTIKTDSCPCWCLMKQPLCFSTIGLASSYRKKKKKKGFVSIESLNTSVSTCAHVGDLMACVLVWFSQPSQPCGDSLPFALANNHSGTSVYTGSYAHTRTPKAISLCYNPCRGCLRDPDKHLWFTSLFPFRLLRCS